MPPLKTRLAMAATTMRRQAVDGASAPSADMREVESVMASMSVRPLTAATA
jgi:hypothetical protein